MAGVDWFSATMHNGAERYHEWVTRAYLKLELMANAGNIMNHRKLLGYEGLSIGNCFVGEREDGAFVQITGETANDWYRPMNDIQVHVSRLDIQITVQTDIYDALIGERAYDDAITYDTNLPRYKQRSIDRHTSKGDGYTLYVGAISGEKRLRVYNKQAQSEDVRYTRCWRYEVVYRNRYSDAMQRSLILAGNTTEQYILSTVVNFAAERGVTIRGLEYVEPVPLVSVVYVPTDVERKLKWLEKQVKPTLRKLSELGYGDEAATAMGLWIPHEA